MPYWDRCVENFYKFRECKARWCKYHGTHYADRVEVKTVPDLDGFKLVSKYLYHENNIATFNGRILRITSAGFITPTTRDRLSAIVSYLDPRYSVHLAQRGFRYDVEYIAMYLYDRVENRNYIISSNIWEYKVFVHYIEIDVVSKEVVNKNYLKELISSLHWGRKKRGIIEIGNEKFAKINSKIFIRLSDLKMFRKVTNTYAFEIDIVELLNNIEHRKDIEMIRSVSKELYKKLIKELRGDNK